MTVAELLAMAQGLSLTDHQRLLVALSTSYAARVRAFRRQRANEDMERMQGCEHIWEEWVTGNKGTFHHRRCVTCRKIEEWDSGD